MLKTKWTTIKTVLSSGLYDTYIIMALVLTAIFGSIGAVCLWEWFKTWL